MGLLEPIDANNAQACNLTYEECIRSLFSPFDHM